MWSIYAFAVKTVQASKQLMVEKIRKGEAMKPCSTHFISTIAVALALTFIPVEAQGSHCSNASVAGSWSYTYTGTIFTPSGAFPLASVGHYTQDREGNVSGSQSRSVAGSSGVEDISGTVSANPDCTGTATVNVLVNGQLQRTAVLAVVYDSNGNHARMIFQSLTLPDETNVPVVITLDANRASPTD
jgi:hypothetical protein